jgi:hypothetical protein
VLPRHPCGADHRERHAITEIMTTVCEFREIGREILKVRVHNVESKADRPVHKKRKREFERLIKER